MNKLIKEIIEPGKPQLLVGDFNFCYLGETTNTTRNFFQSANFKQVIEEPTHLEGNLLDHAYFKDTSRILTCTGRLQTKYYTDHKALALFINKGKLREFFIITNAFGFQPRNDMRNVNLLRFWRTI